MLLLNAGVTLDKWFSGFVNPQSEYFHKDIAIYYQEYVRLYELDRQCDADNRRAKQKKRSNSAIYV